jgi:hypothetical protein
VRLLFSVDYTIDTSTSTLTLAVGTLSGSVVQWDLLVPPENIAPRAVNTFKVTLSPSTPDGTTTSFTMTYSDPTSGTQPVNVTSGVQLQVSLDGVIQEPAADYVATGNTLTMSKAPPAGAHFWVVWFAGLV